MTGNRAERRERILRAAMQLFHERGFDGVSVDQIGERAGMSGPAIYRYFSGKDDILITLIDEAIDRALISTGDKRADPHDDLDHLIVGHIRRAIDERELMSVWTREYHTLPKDYRPRLRARINRYLNRWVECLDACYPGHPQEVLLVAVHSAHGMIDSTALWPSQSLKVTGITEILAGLVRSSLDWLGNAVDPPDDTAHRSS